MLAASFPLGRALAQPMPVIGPVGDWPPSVGPLWSAGGGGPPGVTLDLSFMGGTLPSAVTFTRASTATYVNAAGTLQTAATNAPRFDYNPATLAANGLLLEESRSNLVLWSGDFTQAAWTKSRSSLGVSIAAPDGTNTGACIIEDTTTGGHGVFQLLSKAASALPYTWSAYCKANQRSSFQMMMEGATSGNVYCVFDLVAVSAGTPVVGGTWTGASASIVNAGNGWYRCMLTATSNTDTGIYADAYMASGGNAAYTGDGASSAYIWGAQLEQAAFPTSYIPTSGASATRAADVATFASGGWRNTSAETWCGEFVLPYLHTGSQAIIGNYTSGRTPVYINASGLGGTWDSISATTTANAYTPGNIGKLATSWTTPTGRACLNAAAVASAGGQTAGFAIMTTIQIGNDQSGDIVDGWIRRIRYWPRVLSNTEMQQVTT